MTEKPEDVEYFFEQINDDTCLTYLFGPKERKTAAIVDPKLDYIEQYKDLLKERRLKLKYIVDTHTHADHISGAMALKEEYGADIVMGEKAPVKCVDIRVSEEMQLDLDGISIKFIHTPGHTEDAMSLIIPGKIMTGDALFLDSGGAGRDDLPGGSAARHYETIEKLKKLDESLIVYPAHDYRDRKPSSLKSQKKNNPHMLHPAEHDFIAYIEDLQLGPAEWMKDVLKANHDCSTNPKAAWIPRDNPSCEAMGTMQLEPEVEKIEPKMIKKGELDSRIDGYSEIVLLDVTSRSEFGRRDSNEIAGSINVPLTAIANDVEQLNDVKEKEICVICNSGKRSRIAAQIMVHSGFNKVTVLDGGLRAWHGLEPPK